MALRGARQGRSGGALPQGQHFSVGDTVRNTLDTAAHCAAADGRHEALRALLEVSAPDPSYMLAHLLGAQHGADVGARNKAGHTPLMVAHESCVPVLFEFGAERLIDAVDGEGRSALALAAAHKRTGVVRALLAACAKVDVVDKQGFTPLHRAAEAACSEAVAALLAKGADPTLCNKAGEVHVRRAG